MSTPIWLVWAKTVSGLVLLQSVTLDPELAEQFKVICEENPEVEDAFVNTSKANVLVDLDAGQWARFYGDFVRKVATGMNRYLVETKAAEKEAQWLLNEAEAENKRLRAENARLLGRIDPQECGSCSDGRKEEEHDEDSS